jgi:type I restriction enzyme S subunit
MKNWVEKKLEEVCELITCGVAAKPQYVNDGIPFLSAKNVKEGQIIWSGYNCISEKTHKELTKNNKPLAGDILYTRVGSYGEAAVIENDKEFSVFVSLTLIKVDKSILNNYFLKHYLNSDFIKRLAKKSISGSGVGNLNVGTVRDFPILLPPLSEQQRIVAILDEAFAVIAKAKANAEQNLKNAKELFESYLQGVFDNKDENWEEKRLEEVCIKITDGSHNPPKGIDFSEYLMLSSKNVNNDFIDLNSPRYLKKDDFVSENKRTEVIEGDVLLTIVGTIGRVAVVSNEHKYFTLQRSVAVLKPNKEFILSRFLMYSLQNVHEMLNENARGVAQKGLYLNQIRSLVISIPKLKTQKSIIEKLDYLSVETKKLEAIYQQKINDLEELKKSILQKAFSGELKTNTVAV